MDRRLCRSLALIASLAGGCGLATGSSAWAQQQDAAAVAIEKEQAALPHAVVLDVINQALGERAPEQVRLSATQAGELKAQRASFEKDVREFLKKGMTQNGDVRVPDREAAIKKALAGLNKDQAKVLEKALHDAAGKRFHEKHSSTTTSKDGKTQTSTSSETSSDSQSSHGSQSRHSSQSKSDKHSESKSDKQADRQSDNKSSQKNDQGKSGQRSSESSKQSDSAKANWSKMDAGQRERVVRGLLEEIPAKERADLAKELKLDPTGKK